MGVNSLPKTVIRQRRDCGLNPGPGAPEPSTLTTRLYKYFYLLIYVDDRLVVDVFVAVWRRLCR